jgi:hypothetical protein
MLTLIISVIGIAISYFVGTGLLKLTGAQVLNCVWASQVGAFLALLITTRAERVRWIKKHLLNRSLSTWALLTGVYLGCLVALVPALRGWVALATMFCPLFLTNGFAIMVFGPLQDYLVKREQKQNQLVATKGTEVL